MILLSVFGLLMSPSVYAGTWSHDAKLLAKECILTATEQASVPSEVRRSMDRYFGYYFFLTCKTGGLKSQSYQIPVNLQIYTDQGREGNLDLLECLSLEVKNIQGHHLQHLNGVFEGERPELVNAKFTQTAANMSLPEITISRHNNVAIPGQPFREIKRIKLWVSNEYVIDPNGEVVAPRDLPFFQFVDSLK